MNSLLEQLKNFLENDLTLQHLKNEVKNILKCDRYIYIKSKEPFENFMGKLCYDYSGHVEKDNSVKINFNISIREAFDEIYTGEKIASYTSNCGWFYPTFLDELKNKWYEIKYDKYNTFLENNKENIIKLYKVNNWEFVTDEIDSSDISDYIVFYSNNFFENFVDTTIIKECI